MPLPPTGKTHTANVIAQHTNRSATPFSTFNSAGSNLVRVSVHPDLDCSETMAMVEQRLVSVVESSGRDCVKVLILDEVDVLLEGAKTAQSKGECEGSTLPQASHWLKSCSCKPDSAYYNLMSVLDQFKTPTYLTKHAEGGGKIVPLENLVVILTGTHTRSEQRQLLARHYCSDMSGMAGQSCRANLMKGESFGKQLSVAQQVMSKRVQEIFRTGPVSQSPYSALVPFFYFFQKELKAVTQHLADEYVRPDYQRKLTLQDFQVTDEVVTAITQRSDPELGARDVKQKFLDCVGTFMHNLLTDSAAWQHGCWPKDGRFLGANVTIRLVDAVTTPRLRADIEYEAAYSDDRFKRFVHSTSIDNFYTLEDCTNPGLLNFEHSEVTGSSSKSLSANLIFPTTPVCSADAAESSQLITLDGFRRAFGGSASDGLDVSKFVANGAADQVNPLENFFKRITPWLNTTMDSSQLYEHSSFSILLGGEDQSRSGFVKSLLDVMRPSFSSAVGSIDLTKYHNQQYALNRAFREEVACIVKRCHRAGTAGQDGACIVIANLPPLSEDAWRHTIFPILDTTSPAVDASPLGTDVVSTRQVIFLFSMDYSLKEWRDFCQQLHFRDQKGVEVPAPGSLYDTDAGLGPLRGRIHEIWSLGSYHSVCNAKPKHCIPV